MPRHSALWHRPVSLVRGMAATKPGTVCGSASTSTVKFRAPRAVADVIGPIDGRDFSHPQACLASPAAATKFSTVDELVNTIHVGFPSEDRRPRDRSRTWGITGAVSLNHIDNRAPARKFHRHQVPSHCSARQQHALPRQIVRSQRLKEALSATYFFGHHGRL